MMTYLIWSLPVIGTLFFIYIKRVPHGWVQWRTGLGLKFLPAIDHLSPIVQRAKLDKLNIRGLPRIKKNLPVADIKDFDIPTRHGPVKARLYNDKADAALAPIFYIHGGGFCFGGLDMFEEVCRRLAQACKRQVYSIEYSLAPEYKFPRMHEECEDAAVWLSTHHDALGIASEKLIPMGDSAGGNLAISTIFALRKRGLGNLLAAVVPIYPSLEGFPNETASLGKYGEGYFLTQKAMATFTDALVADREDLKDPRLLLSSVNELKDFPPTFVVNAEFDPLRDDGGNFAERLKSAGNTHVERKIYKGTTHAFFGVGIMGDQGVKAVKDVAAFLRGI
jgi:acetyl esterase